MLAAADRLPLGSSNCRLGAHFAHFQGTKCVRKQLPLWDGVASPFAHCEAGSKRCSHASVLAPLPAPFGEHLHSHALTKPGLLPLLRFPGWHGYIKHQGGIGFGSVATDLRSFLSRDHIRAMRARRSAHGLLQRRGLCDACASRAKRRSAVSHFSDRFTSKACQSARRRGKRKIHPGIKCSEMENRAAGLEHRSTAWTAYPGVRASKSCEPVRRRNQG